MSMIAAALLLLGGAGEAAGTAIDAKASDDPNDPMVCQRYEELGSRLKKRKVCMRKSEWRAQHQEEAQMINRTQVQRGLDPAG